MDKPSYGALTREFLSSFTITAAGLLSFQIANTTHEITKTQLSHMFNWQLVEQQPLPENYATPFWIRIIGLPHTEKYHAQSASASAIISPCYRYFARLLSFTIYRCAEINNKIQTGELALLYNFDAELSIDWTTLLIERLIYQSKRSKCGLVMGGFVTRIVEKLTLFNRKTTNLKVADNWSSKLDVEYLVGMHIVCRCGKLGVFLVPHKRHSTESRQELDEPVQTLEQQVAKLKLNQLQIIKNQERMGKRLDDISASIQRYFSHHTP